MNKLFTKIAAVVLGATMAVGVGAAVVSGQKAEEVKADEQIVLTCATGTNTGTKSTTSENASTLFASASQSYVSGKITTATNVYAATESGLRIGNSSAAGTVKFSLAAAQDVTTVIVRAKRYNTSKASTIKFNGSSEASLPTDGSFKNVSFTVNSSISTIEIWGKYYLYIASITLNLGTVEPYDPVHAGTEADPYDYADAKGCIDAGTGITNVHVGGKVSKVDSFSSGSVTYWISDDGTTTNQLQVYNGKGIGGASFTAKEDVKVGASVKVYGTLKKYNSTYEFDSGSTQKSYSAITGIVVTDNTENTWSAGQNVSASNLKVVVSYTDNTSLNVTDGTGVTITSGNPLVQGSNTISVTYTSNQGTANGSVSITAGAAKVLESIEVTTPPTKTIYDKGDCFDPTGMVVTATYDDESTLDVTGSCTFVPSTLTPLTTSDTSIAISYGGKSTSQSITVNDVIKFISGTDVGSTTAQGSADEVTKENTTVYSTNAAFATAEYRMYKDSTTTISSTAGDIAMVEFTCTEGNPATGFADMEGLVKDGNDAIWTGTAEEVSFVASGAQVRATIIKVALAPKTPRIDVEVTGSTSLAVNGTASLTATKKNGATGTIAWSTNNNKVELSTPVVDGDTSTVTVTGKLDGQSIVKASLSGCDDVDTTFTVTKALSSIAVTNAPTKTTYTEGDSFDPTGMVVTATYDDASTATVTDYTYSPAGGLTPSDTEITISWGGKSTTQAITVNAKVVDHIKIKTQPTKATYYGGDSFISDGLTITICYNAAETDILDDVSTGFTIDPNPYTFTSADEEAGTKQFTVSYSGKNATFNVNVLENITVTSSVVDFLNHSVLGLSGSYNDYSNVSASSPALYSGNAMKGSGDTIQLRSDNTSAKPASGAITTSSTGYAKAISVVWGNSTQADRTLDIYGSNTPYGAMSDLWDESTSGDLLGSIVKGTSTELAITGNYRYIGFRSRSGAAYLTSVKILWETSTAASADVTALAGFITSNMHLDYTKSEGFCKEGENPWFDTAVAAFNNDSLSDNARLILATSSSKYGTVTLDPDHKDPEDTGTTKVYTYADIRLRLETWAAKNNKVITFNQLTGKITTSNASSRAISAPMSSENVTAIVVIISVVSLTAIGGYFFLRKRREQ